MRARIGVWEIEDMDFDSIGNFIPEFRSVVTVGILIGTSVVVIKTGNWRRKRLPFLYELRDMFSNFCIFDVHPTRFGYSSAVQTCIVSL